MSRKQLNTAAIQNELAGSVYFARPAAQAIPQSPTRRQRKTHKTEQTSEVRKSRTTEVPKSGSAAVPELRSYELRKYDRLRRLDVRLTREQLRFLQELEDDIRERMPEIERDNPEHRRITKSAIVRVLVEMFRQLDLRIDARKFRNEHDLMNELHRRLIARLRQSGSAAVPQSQSSEVTESI
jgi:hypothetical protein